MALPGVQAELAAASREVNLAFAALPVNAQEVIDVRRDALEVEIDRAILRGDRELALRCIDAWKQHWLREIGKAGK